MWFAGLWLDEMPLPSPKFHDQMLLQPGVDMLIEPFVVSNWVTFFLPLIGPTVKLETGRAHDVGGDHLGDRVVPPAFVDRQPDVVTARCA